VSRIPAAALEISLLLFFIRWQPSTFDPGVELRLAGAASA
jgi:hypothetical protein